jgi:hypothetical protein
MMKVCSDAHKTSRCIIELINQDFNINPAFLESIDNLTIHES